MRIRFFLNFRAGYIGYFYSERTNALYIQLLPFVSIGIFGRRPFGYLRLEGDVYENDFGDN